ncbi:Peptidoglycan-binding Lysin subgroup [Penicillium italicum]|uniref:Peptidoglycan-binding Lysin subgroup n=1 Tax=Penicillium italicum TaxID=40296 RepID=A0A0A2LD87_PENIT|nr:Peptidoglycan-binding Lysin subgroup [Penicillium italicum]
MVFIHILLSVLFSHIATAQYGHGFGDSHGHSLSKRAPSGPSGDGICHTYIIQEGDTCVKLAERYQLTTSNIETWNAGSWGWSGCAKIKQGDFVCLSSGAFPMPITLPNAVCGPQVPGTMRPAKYSDLASLNPCPSNQCCAKSGQCGTLSDFCDVSPIGSCIFNCGTKNATKSAASGTTTVKSTTTSKTTSTSKSTTASKITKVVEEMVTRTSIKMVQPPDKTKTSVAPTATWQITIYEKGGCKGDYFSVQGHENQNVGGCIVLADNTDTKISDTTTSCRWWSNGGLNWGTCASSKLVNARSFFIKSGTCSVFSGKKCQNEDWVGETYAPFKGCQDGNTGYMSPPEKAKWGSLQCYEYQASAEQ